MSFHSDFTINDYLNLINYKIADGSEFGWNCYGPNAYLYSYSKYSDEGSLYELNVVFDTVDRLVYEVEFYEELNMYKWYNPSFKDAYIEEENQRSAIFHFSKLEYEDFTDRTDEFKALINEVIKKYD